MASTDVTVSCCYVIREWVCRSHREVVDVVKPQDSSSEEPHYHFLPNITAT
jgi:hypothetical protein